MMPVVRHVELRRIGELGARRKVAARGTGNLVRTGDRSGELLRADARAVMHDGVLWVLIAGGEGWVVPEPAERVVADVVVDAAATPRLAHLVKGGAADPDFKGWTDDVRVRTRACPVAALRAGERPCEGGQGNHV